MHKPLILIAAGGLARETAEAVRALGGYRLRGFLDDRQELWGQSVAGLPVLGSLSELPVDRDTMYLVCAGKGATRQRIVQRLAQLGVTDQQYATIVHPRAVVPASVEVGTGSLILAGCVMTADISIGRHVVCMPHVTLTHDDVLEDYATLCAGVTLGGSVRVGARAYLGMNSSVREGVQIGVDVLLGMAAAALEDVPAHQTWVGVPARPITRTVAALPSASPAAGADPVSTTRFGTS